MMRRVMMCALLAACTVAFAGCGDSAKTETKINTQPKVTPREESATHDQGTSTKIAQ